MFRQAQSNSTARVSASPRRWRRTRSKPPARWLAVVVIMAAWGTRRRPASRAERFWAGANARGIPLQAIVATVAVVAATYLAGKLLYRLRDVVLLLLVAGFFAVLLNPCVNALQRWGIRRRGVAVFAVTLLSVLIFAGLAVAFGIPLSRGITHLAHAMPGYVVKAEHGRGWAGHLVRHYHVAAWVRRNESKLIRFGQDLTRPALTVGKGAASLVAALATPSCWSYSCSWRGPR